MPNPKDPEPQLEVPKPKPQPENGPKNPLAQQNELTPSLIRDIIKQEVEAHQKNSENKPGKGAGVKNPKNGPKNGPKQKGPKTSPGQKPKMGKTDPDSWTAAASRARRRLLRKERGRLPAQTQAAEPFHIPEPSADSIEQGKDSVLWDYLDSLSKKN